MSTHRVRKGFNVERRNGDDDRFEPDTMLDAKAAKLTKKMVADLERDDVIEPIGGGDA